MNSLWIVIKIPGFWMKIIEAILSITTVYLIYYSYLETHSIHTSHIVEGTSFTYFLISGTLVTEYLSEETSHFTESVFLLIGILFEYVSAFFCLYYYTKLIESNLLTEEFFVAGILFLITGSVMLVDFLCILFLKWPDNLAVESGPFRRIAHRERAENVDTAMD